MGSVTNVSFSAAAADLPPPRSAQPRSFDSSTDAMRPSTFPSRNLALAAGRVSRGHFRGGSSKRRNALSDGAIDAHLPSLTRLKTLTMAKYVAVLCAVVALTTSWLCERAAWCSRVRRPGGGRGPRRHPNTRRVHGGVLPAEGFLDARRDVVSACGGSSRTWPSRASPTSSAARRRAAGRVPRAV